MDIESIDAIDIANNTFVERNFTDAEVAYCRKAPNQQASFTGKWSAKEAVFKSLKVQSRGAGAPLKDIEIVNDESGAPVVTVSSFLSSSGENPQYIICDCELTPHETAPRRSQSRSRPGRR